jgi:sugar phosphate isomerase/epimerase
MSEQHRLNRRTFLGAAAGAAAGAAMSPFGPSLGFGDDDDRRGGRGRRLVDRDKIGIQQWTIRDATPRLNGSVTGFLGGPTFPDDPTDLGPPVPLPGGFAAVFEYLASVGYEQFEFFQLSQGANGPITTEQIRQALDNAGLRSAGTHTGGLSTMVNPTTRQTQIDIAHTLGHHMIGTAGDPVGGSGAFLLGNWQVAAENYNIVGQALRAEGLKYYLHPEQNNFNFFNDPAHPDLNRVHRIDWFADNTDRRLVFFEPDTLHMFAGRARFPDPIDGRLWDAEAWLKKNERRLTAWHVKDGVRVLPPPAPPTNPFTQTMARTPTFTDVVYAGEGSIGQGYPVDPDPQVVGFAELFSRFTVRDPGHYLSESDSGPGPATGPNADPGRSLRYAKVAAKYLRELRESDRDDCDDDD